MLVKGENASMCLEDISCESLKAVEVLPIAFSDAFIEKPSWGAAFLAQRVGYWIYF